MTNIHQELDAFQCSSGLFSPALLLRPQSQTHPPVLPLFHTPVTSALVPSRVSSLQSILLLV